MSIASLTELNMTRLIFNFLVVALAIINYSNAQDYCNIQSCARKGYRQTMCQYPSNRPAQACLRRGDMGGSLSAADRIAIMNRHNEHRRRVASGLERRGSPGPQPAARSMPDLTWDNELAMIAQRWADQCIWDHDKCRDVERYYVGQNLAYRSTSGNANTISVVQLVDDWYEEVTDFDRSIVSSYRGTNKMTGHYTQLVWGESTKIGCGVRIYFDGRLNRKYLACNYGPGGNIQTRPVYQAR